METNAQNIQERISKVSAKVQFLKHQQEQNEKEKKTILEELAKLGIKNADELKTAIDTKTAEFESNKLKLDKAVTLLEEQVAQIEKSL